MSKHSQSIDNKVLARIYGRGRGNAFTPTHFQDLGTDAAVRQALVRHAKKGTIRRLARGLYDYPRKHPKLGTLEPSVDQIAQALSGRDATRLQPSGAYAANLLGLSTQVPMKVVYLTDGASRTVQVGNRQIVLTRTTPRNMATAGKISGLVIQALKHLGKDNIDSKLISQLSSRLSLDDRAQLANDIRHAPAWIGGIFRQLIAAGSDSHE